VRQQSFLTELGESLPKASDEVRIALNNIKSEITKPKNMTIHIATSLAKLGPINKQRAVDFGSLIKKVSPNNDPLGPTKRFHFKIEPISSSMSSIP
jgi:hypothetical protein